MDKTVLACGPYIGSFEQEILNFRPYMRWVEEHFIGADKIFYSSHYNRRFLYSHVHSRRFVPVDRAYTRAEITQNGYIHVNVPQRQYSKSIKKYKDKIVSNTGCIKKDISMKSLPYVSYPSPVSVFHKIWEPIKVPSSNKKGHVVFIPDIRMDYDDALVIYDYLSERTKFSMIGDMKCHLVESNEIVSNPDYFDNGYQKIITAITNASCVICPCSHWTVLANLQCVPVLSWGNSVAPYKEEGMYRLGNKDATVFYHDIGSNRRNLLSHIDNFLQRWT